MRRSARWPTRPAARSSTCCSPSPNPHAAGAIPPDVGGPRAATSRHLRALRGWGLVAVDPPAGDARLRVYRLRAERLAALRAWLDQVEAHWAEQLGAFKDHVDRQRSE